MLRKIIIGADPLGCNLKENVKEYLLRNGYDVEDVGTCTDGRQVAYYDVGAQVGKRISDGEFDRGIIFCGTGMGVNIVANKFPGVYCGLCESVLAAKLCRTINNCNVLAIGGLFTGSYKAIQMVEVFLNTEFAEDFSEASPDFLQQSYSCVQNIESIIHDNSSSR